MKVLTTNSTTFIYLRRQTAQEPISLKHKKSRWISSTTADFGVNCPLNRVPRCSNVKVYFGGETVTSLFTIATGANETPFSLVTL